MKKIIISKSFSSGGQASSTTANTRGILSTKDYTLDSERKKVPSLSLNNGRQKNPTNLSIADRKLNYVHLYFGIYLC